MEYLEIPWRPDETEEEDDDRSPPPRPDAGGHPPQCPPGAAMAQLARIHELMEGTATYRVLSGGSAIVAGLIALAACSLSAAVVGAPGGLLAPAPLDPGALRALTWIWGSAFVLAAAVELTLTKRAARRLRTSTFHFPSGSPMLRRMRLAYSAPLFVGASLTLALARAGATDAIPAAWLLSYGAALLCAGLFSTRPVRVLGTAFLGLGAVASVAPSLGLVLLAGGFGIAQIAYGIHVRRDES